MPPRKRSTSTIRSTTAKKSTPVGTSPAFVLAAESGQTMALSYWDLWFVLVANANFGSSWDRFVEHLRSQQGTSRRFAERKLSHIRDLQRRLQQADVAIDDIVAQADPSPAELRRARNQVLKREPREHEWSEAMRKHPSATSLRPRHAWILAVFSRVTGLLRCPTRFTIPNSPLVFCEPILSHRRPARRVRGGRCR